MRFKNKICQSLQEGNKKLSDGELKFFKSRYEDLVAKSDSTLNSQTKYLQEGLR